MCESVVIGMLIVWFEMLCVKISVLQLSSALCVDCIVIFVIIKMKENSLKKKTKLKFKKTTS
jgi:hypothetical protein